MANPEPPSVTVPVSLNLVHEPGTGRVLLDAQDVLRTLDDLAVVYTTYGWPTVAASLGSFRTNLTAQVQAATKQAP